MNHRSLLLLLLALFATDTHAALPTPQYDWPVSLRYASPNNAAGCGGPLAISDIVARAPQACNPQPLDVTAFTSRADVCVSSGRAWQSVRYGNPAADPQTSPNARNFDCAGAAQTQVQTAVSKSDECDVNALGELEQRLCYTPGLQAENGDDTSIGAAVFAQRGNFTLQFQYYSTSTCDEASFFMYQYLRGSGDCRVNGSGGGSSMYRNNANTNIVVTTYSDDACSMAQQQAQAVLEPGQCIPSTRSPLDNGQTYVSWIKVAILTPEQVQAVLPPGSEWPEAPTASPTPSGDGDDDDDDDKNDDDDDSTSGAFFAPLSTASLLAGLWILLG